MILTVEDAVEHIGLLGAEAHVGRDDSGEPLWVEARLASGSKIVAYRFTLARLCRDFITLQIACLDRKVRAA